MKPPLLQLLLLSLAATPLMAATTPDGVDEATWASIERQIEAEVDRDLVAGKAGFERGAFGSEHGLTRTASVAGDYSELAPQDNSDGPRFGHSVAIDGDWLAVGAPGTIWTHATHGTADHGAVFVFRRQAGGWTLVQRLLSTNTPAGGRCGHAIALQLPYLAVGCPDVDNASGTQINGWVRVWRLNEAGTLFFNFTSHPGFSNGRCGSSLALSQDYLAVGCPTVASDDQGGRVRIYRRDPDTSTFALEATLSPPNAMANARFGDSVALNQSLGMPPRLAAGAPLRSPNPFIASGGVHVFERSSSGGTPSWSQSAFVTAPNQASFAFFGLSVDLVRSNLLVGAPNDFCPAGSQRCGRVFRYSRSGSNWNFAETGFPTNVPGGAVSGPESGMAFGATVAFGYDFLIAVGAPNTDGTREQFGTTAADVGLVELRRGVGNNYNANGYRGVVRPEPLFQLALANGRFGTSIDFSNSARRMVVGYPGAGLGLPSSGPRGQVWIYETDQIFADGFQTP